MRHCAKISVLAFDIMNIQRGFRDRLDKYLNIDQAFEVEIFNSGAAVYDCCCFGVDENNKLSDDRYMIFYNQDRSPHGEISYSVSGGITKFSVNLSKLSRSISKLVFTVSIDGNGKMGEIISHEFSVSQGNSSVINMRLTGNDFHDEKAIISVEIYKKDSWRIAGIAGGFNGGLRELLKSYGGEEMKEPPVPKPQKISLEKKLQDGAPQLVSLAKPLKVELEKRNLQECVARVALVLDISGSMFGRYSDGTVQEIVNKTLPMAVQFDDDGELDFWYYGSRCERMPSVNMGNYKTAVPNDWPELMTNLGGGTNAANVIKEVMVEYEDSKIPAYVIFISDGAFGDENSVKSLIVKASKQPIFWQFVGVGGYGYGLLEKLDTMSGRYIDNANFFALDDFKRVQSHELYSRLLNEFPKWLKEASEKKILK